MIENKKIHCIDKMFDDDETNSNFLNYLFIRVVAKKKKFINVDFKYSFFDTAYLRDCVFDSCDFTGCRFFGSNFHGSKFSGCKFDYATFERTQIDNSILSTECPALDNLKSKFARTLRMNYGQLGDAESVNKAILIELEATKVHLKKAWNSNESYYRKKYSGFERFLYFLRWLSFIFFDFVWGNGEKPLKLFLSLIYFLALIAFVAFWNSDIKTFQTLFEAFIFSPQFFLGTAKASGMWFTFVQFIRYVFFAFLMSILIKRLSRR